MTSAQERKIRQTGCDVRVDNLTRQLYATDASIYQIEPRGVAFPKGAEQASAVIRAAADAGVSVTPRGAGTSLVGNAIGEGLIVEFSRYNRQITDLDIEKLIRARSTEMVKRWPPGLIKRWPGYGIERFLRAPNDLTNIFAGSEGTLAAIFSAELKISPLPSEKGLGLIFFSSVDEAMQA